MEKVYHGEVYYYVDTICVYEVVYDVYENDRGNHIYEPIDTIK